jgi:hypothetical protein
VPRRCSVVVRTVACAGCELAAVMGDASAAGGAASAAARPPAATTPRKALRLHAPRPRAAFFDIAVTYAPLSLLIGRAAAASENDPAVTHPRTEGNIALG